MVEPGRIELPSCTQLNWLRYGYATVPVAGYCWVRKAVSAGRDLLRQAYSVVRRTCSVAGPVRHCPACPLREGYRSLPTSDQRESAERVGEAHLRVAVSISWFPHLSRAWERHGAAHS